MSHHPILKETIMSEADRITNIKINPDNLYKEESFTDLTFATIRRLSPVNIDGSPDEPGTPFHRDGSTHVPQRTHPGSVSD